MSANLSTDAAISAVHDPRSIGVRTYLERLSAALSELGVDYRPASRPAAHERCHFHLANSTRAVVPHAARRSRGFLLTVHDVLPRSAVLQPLQRALILPLCARRASRVLVHSEHAARMLTRVCALDSARIEIVPHPATAPASRDREAARRALGLASDGPPVFVLPGVLRTAKLVGETLAAARPLIERGSVRLLLAGRVPDGRLVEATKDAGALLLDDPAPAAYESAIVAADAIVCLRRDSVGESNGPLLDAIGAHRASLVTAAGSGPEIAGDAALVVEPTVAGIRAGIEALLDPGERSARARTAALRARELTWSAAAVAHRDLLDGLPR